MKRTLYGIASTLLVAAGAHAQSGIASVDAKNATYLAGGNVYTIAPTCAIGGCINPGGTAPVAIALTAGTNRVLTFSLVEGTMTFCPAGACGTSGPDGPAATLPTTNLNASGRVSGIQANTSGFLAGVFLGGALPGSAPASLNFSTIGLDFTSLTPLLGQQFFIGNGRTSGGVVQQFFVPDAATTLYLGIADGFAFQGDPAAYDDNVGTYRATYAITAVPEPSTLMLMGVGLGLVVIARRRHA